MQAPDGDDADAAYFAAQVSNRTEGRVRIVVDGNRYTSLDPDNELRLVRDLRAGKVPLAYVPSRAWERAGVNSFRALQAPFLIRNYDLLRQITTGEVGHTMLKSLDRVGLVGLGLVPEELRRPLGRRPLTTLQSFGDARIRVVTSPTGELALRSLGARPLTTFDAHQASAALADRKLDGLETEAHAIVSNDYAKVAHYLTANLPLFAKAQTIVIRGDVLSRMSASDQAAVRAAAQEPSPTLTRPPKSAPRWRNCAGRVYGSSRPPHTTARRFGSRAGERTPPSSAIRQLGRRSRRSMRSAPPPRTRPWHPARRPARTRPRRSRAFRRGASKAG